MECEICGGNPKVCEQRTRPVGRLGEVPRQRRHPHPVNPAVVWALGVRYAFSRAARCRSSAWWRSAVSRSASLCWWSWCRSSTASSASWSSACSACCRTSPCMAARRCGKLRRRDALAAIAGVTGVAPFVQGAGLAAVSDRVAGVLILGHRSPPPRCGLRTATRSRGCGSEPGAYRVVLGVGVAKRLGVGVGDRVTLVLPAATVTPAGVFPRQKQFEVAGCCARSPRWTRAPPTCTSPMLPPVQAR
jgi:hypothetical protein